MVVDLCITGMNNSFQNIKTKPTVIKEANIVLTRFFIKLLLTKSINLFNIKLNKKNTVNRIIIPKITANIIIPKKYPKTNIIIAINNHFNLFKKFILIHLKFNYWYKVDGAVLLKKTTQ